MRALILTALLAVGCASVSIQDEGDTTVRVLGKAQVSVNCSEEGQPQNPDCVKVVGASISSEAAGAIRGIVGIVFGAIWGIF